MCIYSTVKNLGFMSCMSTFGHSCRPTMSKSWTFVLDLIFLWLLTQLKVKVFDTSAAYNKFFGTIFLLLAALALLGKLIPGKGFQYFHFNFVFGVKCMPFAITSRKVER